MHRLIFVLAVTSLAFGCATADETVAPDGRKAYSIDCSGSGRTWAMCMSRAGEVCPKGYDVVAGGTQTAGSTVGGTANRSGAAIFGAPVIDRSMLIACK